MLAVGVWNHVPFSGTSDDLVLVPRLSMNRGATMTYLANYEDPEIGLSWVQEAFDDSDWESGRFGVGLQEQRGLRQPIESAKTAMTLNPYPESAISTTSPRTGT